MYDAKGMAELALVVAGAPGAETEPWAPGQEPAYLEPGRAARLVRDGADLGWFGEVSARVREVFDLAAPVFVAEVALSALAARPAAVPRYAPLPRFPAVQRDLALVVADDVTVAQVEAAIRGMDVPWLARVPLFDVYSGSQVGAGRRSLAWGLTFQAPDRTLTDAEVNEQHDRVVRELGRRFDAEVRGVDGGPMADSLVQRLEQLEQSIKRAAEVIARLRVERDALKVRIDGFETERAELRTLRQERKDVLTQVDAILRELDKIEL